MRTYCQTRRVGANVYVRRRSCRLGPSNRPLLSRSSYVRDHLLALDVGCPVLSKRDFISLPIESTSVVLLLIQHRRNERRPKYRAYRPDISKNAAFGAVGIGEKLTPWQRLNNYPPCGRLRVGESSFMVDGFVLHKGGEDVASGRMGRDAATALRGRPGSQDDRERPGPGTQSGLMIALSG